MEYKLPVDYTKLHWSEKRRCEGLMKWKLNLKR